MEPACNKLEQERGARESRGWVRICRKLRHLLLGCIVLTLSGCWEEIHYSPSKSPVVRSTEPEAVEVAQVEKVEDEGPSSDELFGNDADPEIPVEEPTESIPEDLVADRVPLVETPLDEPQLAESRPEESMDDLFGEDDGESPAIADDLLESENSESAELEWTEVMRPSRTALAAWKIGSQWSYAAAIHAKGLGEEFYGDALQQANYAAELLEMELPEFPTPEQEELQAAVIDFLIHAGRLQIADQLGDKYSPEYAALAELAIKSHVLLLVYTPKSQHLGPIVGAIRGAAENSTLPPTLWEELVELLEQRAPYSEVKAAVLKLHEQVGDYLGGS